MNYGRLQPTPSVRVTEPDPPNPSTPSRKKARFLALLAGILLLASAAAFAAVIKSRAARSGRNNSGSGPGPRRPTRAIREACGLTRYPGLCVESLVDFPAAMVAGDPRDLAHISVNMTLMRFGRALSMTSEVGNWDMNSMCKSAYEDCLELLEDSVDLLARSLISVSPLSSSSVGGSKQDVLTWLSGAMTNQDTCTEGLSYADGKVKDLMAERLRDLSELVSNCLSIYAAINKLDDDDFSNTPIQNRRRRRLLGFEPGDKVDLGFPQWMSRSERELLVSTPPPPQSGIQADIIVAQDGSGTVKTITEAIKKAPENSPRRIIIHVKAGTYTEANLKVGRKKTNLWFLGEGKGKTVISGQMSVGHDQITTFHTASFAATGTGFVARDITFVNEAGPGNHQAVALRVGADHAVIYRCEVKGYQDTLYVHSQRQFYRECDIYGTIDFIFGNAVVVFQNCTMWARKPLALQKNTITAQNRKDPNQNTGMSIHACQTRATMDLEAAKSSYPTYLGRPWKIYSRVVYMESFLGDHIDPRGWLEWNATSPVDKLYYGEYGNLGPRADTSQRVKWPGLHVNMSRGEAQKFTVAQFIFGQDWITATGVAYQAGLSS